MLNRRSVFERIQMRRVQWYASSYALARGVSRWNRDFKNKKDHTYNFSLTLLLVYIVFNNFIFLWFLEIRYETSKWWIAGNLKLLISSKSSKITFWLGVNNKHGFLNVIVFEGCKLFFIVTNWHDHFCGKITDVHINIMQNRRLVFSFAAPDKHVYVV